MNIKRLANKARNSISRYCYEECKAYCCRRGYLPLTAKQAEFFRKALKNQELVKEIKDNKFSLHLNPEACPYLKDFKCTIHNSRKRPQCCREFPLFIQGKTIRLSPRCPAVKEGKFYPYIKKFLSLGYTIDNNFYDFEPVDLPKNT